MPAAGAVGAPAGSEFDASFVEVLLEASPLVFGRFAVFLGGALSAPPVEEFRVVADHILLEDRDVAAGGLDFEVTEQRGADARRRRGATCSGGGANWGSGRLTWAARHGIPQPSRSGCRCRALQCRI